MRTLHLETPEGVSLRRELGGAGSRAGAAALDYSVFFLVYLLLVVVLLEVTDLDSGGLGAFVLGLLIGGLLLGFASYALLLEVLWKGQSFGKRLFGLRVVALDGYPATFGQHALRAMLLPVDFFLVLVVPLGLWLIAATRHHQRLGDLAARTVVVRVERREDAREPWASTDWSSYENAVLPLAPGMVARLDRRDVGLLRDLVTRSSLEPRARQALFERAARHYAERLDLPEVSDPRIVLKEVFLFAREHLQRRSA